MQLSYNNGKPVSQTVSNLGLLPNLLHRWRREAKQVGRVFTRHGKARDEEMAVWAWRAAATTSGLSKHLVSTSRKTNNSPRSLKQSFISIIQHHDVYGSPRMCDRLRPTESATWPAAGQPIDGVVRADCPKKKAFCGDDDG